MRCAVFNCKKNSVQHHGISFFTFPKDKKLLKKWVNFCNRKDKFNTKSSHVCSEHFKAEDFENNLKFEMGFSQRRFLVAGAYPTIKVEPPIKPSNRSLRMIARQQKDLVEKLIESQHEVPESQDEVEISTTVVENDPQKISENKMKLLTTENFTLKQQKRKLLVEICELKEKLAKEKYINANIEKLLSQYK